MQLIAAGESFNGCNLLRGNGDDLGDAGPLCFSVDQDGAGAALAFSASVLASGQIELLAQSTEQAGLRVGIDRV
jgi:hypothetical protein